MYHNHDNYDFNHFMKNEMEMKASCKYLPIHDERCYICIIQETSTVCLMLEEV